MFDGEAGLDAAERWLDDWQAGVEQQAARVRDLGRRVRELTATAASDDGFVEVTVTSTGALAGLRLDEAVRGRPAAETAATILAVTRAAIARLTEQVTLAAEETLGPDSAIARAVIDSYARRLRTAPEGDRDDGR